MDLSKPSKQIKITRLQAAVTTWKQSCNCGKGFIRRRTAEWLTATRRLDIEHQPHCGFATRSRKEAGQQEASSYGKIQLLSDRSRQKRASTKPVSFSEKPTQTAL